MDIELRTILVIGGVLIMILILIDGFRRMYKNRREALKLDVRGDLKFPDDSYASELPNGGARVLGDELDQDPLDEQYLDDNPLDDQDLDRSDYMAADLVEVQTEEQEEEKEQASYFATDEESAADVEDDEDAPALAESTDQEQASYEPKLNPVDDHQANNQYPADTAVEEPIQETSSELAEDVLPADYELPPVSKDDEYDQFGEKKKKYEEEFVDLEISEVRVRTIPEEPEIIPQPVNLDEQVPVLMDVEELGDEQDVVKPDLFARTAQESETDEHIELTAKDAVSIRMATADIQSVMKPEIPDAVEQYNEVQDDVSPIEEVAGILAEINQTDDDVSVDGSVDTPVDADFTKPAEEEAEEQEEAVQYVEAQVKHASADAESLSNREDPKIVLVFHILAQSEEGFLGEDLVYLINNCDLRYGEKNIFHRFENAHGVGNIQFSMANVENPGSFDLSTMMSDRYKGVSLFMSLPGAEKALDAFEAMSEMSMLIARNLEGEVLDESRSAVTPQTIDYSRQLIRDFVRKQRLLKR